MAAAEGLSGSETAAMAEAGDGPVLSMMSKRLRALRKKYNRILQMEERLAEGKSLNKEQEEVLRSKDAISVLIEEYEKLRLPLSAAVQEELSLARLSSSPAAAESSPLSPPPAPEEERQETKPAQGQVEAAAAVGEGELQRDHDAVVEDLLNLLYFGCLFDVKSQSEFASMVFTRTHERECCLTYDYVTDDSTGFLQEGDLDLISALGSLIISRPAHSGVSHKNALLGCLQHAKHWLRNSDLPIQPGSSVTYAGLRERFHKILASDYFTTTPELKAPVDVAAAVGKYATYQVQVSDSTPQPPSSHVDVPPVQYQVQADQFSISVTHLQDADGTILFLADEEQLLVDARLMLEVVQDIIRCTRGCVAWWADSWAQSAHRFCACECDKRLRHILNTTTLVVAFLLPLFGGLRLHGCRVSCAGQLADVGLGKATTSYVAFRLLQRFSWRFGGLVVRLVRSYCEDVAWSGEDAVPWMVFAFFAK
ncbi:hypothetical protein Taro_032550, partial [Colocasia esculenta]|nr:hypothetical protein [Colocasia esculenta]